MSIIEDVFARAGLTEVKVEDLRPGDTFILREPEDDTIYEGTAGRIDGDILLCQGDSLGLSIYEVQHWYLVERAPVEEPTGWGAVVEVSGVKYSRIPDEGAGAQDSVPWVREAGLWYDWDEVVENGAPKILFEGISE